MVPNLGPAQVGEEGLRAIRPDTIQAVRLGLVDPITLEAGFQAVPRSGFVGYDLGGFGHG